jgi:DNA-binding XRE family transcriptional regulator
VTLCNVDGTLLGRHPRKERGIMLMAKASDVFVPYLRSWRADKGMTQEELAAAADVSRNTVLRAEAGGAVNVRTLAKLARALGITVHELRHTNPETK